MNDDKDLWLCIDDMSDDQFDTMMEEGLRQAKSGETVPAEEVFIRLEKILSECRKSEE